MTYVQILSLCQSPTTVCKHGIQCTGHRQQHHSGNTLTDGTCTHSGALLIVQSASCCMTCLDVHLSEVYPSAVCLSSSVDVHNLQRSR